MQTFLSAENYKLQINYKNHKGRGNLLITPTFYLSTNHSNSLGD